MDGGGLVGCRERVLIWGYNRTAQKRVEIDMESRIRHTRIQHGLALTLF